MEESMDSLGDAISRWNHRPTPQQRTAVRHALSRLFDDLAPMGAPPRGAPRPVGPVERHRSPDGCILQSSTNAVSVSWFAAGDSEAAFGELVVLHWRGVVSRPGSARRERPGAVVLQQMTLRPVEVEPTVWAWQGTDETRYECDGLADHCRDLLVEHAVARTAVAAD